MLKKIIKKTISNIFYKQSLNFVQSILGTSAISLLDIGAAHGAPERWKFFKKHIDYYGVEPDPRSSESVLVKDSKDGYHSQSLITKAIWDVAGEVTLNLCRKPMTSSIYKPNSEFVKLFPDPERFDILSTVNLVCDTVDNIAQKSGLVFDAIKLDIQGGELNAIKGASGVLNSTLAVEVEIEFTHLYTDQPLFDEIFSTLRKSNFEFMDFVSIYRWSVKEINGTGQLTFADALFMKAPEAVVVAADESAIRKYAAICAVYERGDLLIRLGDSLRSAGLNPDLCNRINQFGFYISKRNAKSQKKYGFASKFIQLTHPGARAHMLH